MAFSTPSAIFWPQYPGSGMQVIVKSGKAWFNRTWSYNDAPMPLTIPAADVTLKRYDAVVLEVNTETATRANSIKIVSRKSPAQIRPSRR